MRQPEISALSGRAGAGKSACPGGDGIPVTIGHFATTRVNGTFSLAYVVFNTIENLVTQEAQVACFRNAGAHLEPGGCFVIEVGVPELRRLPPGQDVVPWRAGPGTAGVRRLRHGHPGDELELRHGGDGMRLRDRWEGWSRPPFTSQSSQHVPVWEKG